MKPWDDEQLVGRLAAVYGPAIAPSVAARLRAIAEATRASTFGHDAEDEGLSEKTVVLIAYGDQVCEPGLAPLHTLTKVIDETIGQVVTHVHVLPFFPYSSDAGFSVIDYEQVDPELGTWEDIHRLARRFGLMVDLVLNHMSAQSTWFKAFLAGEAPYRNFFITVAEDADLSRVIRPRTSPLLTQLETRSGAQLVWTTFGGDQVDLNYANPEVLLKMVEVLLGYAAHGAKMVRLDAVGFLWKEAGTSCIHLPQTHGIIQILRAVLDSVAPDVLLVSETNVPHAENITYFGDGENEAQMVYQFPLPPLVLSAFQQGDASPLTDWLRSIDDPPGSGMFFNFLASHDGIGLRPADGILSRSSVQSLVERTLAHGGRVSYRTSEGRTVAPYELNISYFDALSEPGSREPLDLQVCRFLTAHAMMLCLAGVPGIYLHSLFGSRSWPEGVELTGSNRAINRERLQKDRLLNALTEPSSLRSRVLEGFRRLLLARGTSRAFHPRSRQEVLSLDPRLFVVRRWDPASGASVCCFHNVTAGVVSVSVDSATLGFPTQRHPVALFGSATCFAGGENRLLLEVAPLETVWLAKERA